MYRHRLVFRTSSSIWHQNLYDGA